MKIAPVNYCYFFPKYTANFKGSGKLQSEDFFPRKEVTQAPKLYHFLKKRLHNAWEVTDVLALKSEEERYIGSLPVNWVKSFNPDDIKAKTKEIQHIFSDFAVDAISTEEHPYELEEDPPLDRLKQRLDESLNTDCSVEFIDGGDYGRVYRIQALGEDTALKIFYSDTADILKAFHGNPMEISNAAALFHTLKPNQCSRFYCAKISNLEEKDGFMLTKFVEKDDKRYPEPTQWDYSRFLYVDASRNDGKNYIAGRLVDYGDVRPRYYNYQEQQIAKKIFPLVKKQDIEGLKKLRAQYSGDEHWKKLCKRLTYNVQSFIKQPNYFAEVLAPKMTREDVDIYSALETDFTPIEKYDYSKLPEDVVQNVRNLGFDV